MIRIATLCPGCGRLSREGQVGRCDLCLAEQRQQDDRRRGSRHQRGYTSRWDRARLEFLRENPWCAACLEDGRWVEAKEVDHIVPHRSDSVRFWDVENWQGLCRTCHLAKTARGE